jgi:predicted ATPase
VLVQSYYAPAGSTVIFEQPEIHLHPKVAADLADVLIDASEACDVQFIVESHSEHFLQRLQRRIAEERTNETKVALYACDVVEGASTIADLEVDLFGNIRNWPKDFFGDPVGDAAARAKATIARKKKLA